MIAPQFWIVAGPNGAGKTTCVQKEPISSLLPEVTFLNPDDRTLSKLQAIGYQGFIDAPVDVQTRLFIESANEVFSEIEERVAARTPVGVETVLSSEKYRTIVRTVLDCQGFVGLIYVALASAAIAKDRVSARVQRGGHGIPAEKIEQRWRRSLDNLRWFAENSSAFWVIDNSDSKPANVPVLLASGKFGALEFLANSAFSELKAALASMTTK